MCTRYSLLVAGAAVVLALAPARVRAQEESPSLPVDLPDGPAIAGFDIDRFSNAGNGFFETFYVEDTEPLSQALQDERVANDTRVMVFETAAGRLALLIDQMAFHHLARAKPGAKIGWPRFEGRATAEPVWFPPSTARCTTSTSWASTTRSS